MNIFGDSNLVCYHVSKKWGWNGKRTKWIPHKDASHLKKYLDEALNLLQNHKYEINWIPREQNQEADQLPKEALVKGGIKLNVQRKMPCLECAGFLVFRKGKFGDFYGCSNYPRCKHTQKSASEIFSRPLSYSGYLIAKERNILKINISYYIHFVNMLL